MVLSMCICSRGMYASYRAFLSSKCSAVFIEYISFKCALWDKFILMCPLNKGPEFVHTTLRGHLKGCETYSKKAAPRWVLRGMWCPWNWGFFFEIFLIASDPHPLKVEMTWKGWTLQCDPPLLHIMNYWHLLWSRIIDYTSLHYP